VTSSWFLLIFSYHNDARSNNHQIYTHTNSANRSVNNLLYLSHLQTFNTARGGWLWMVVDMDLDWPVYTWLQQCTRGSKKSTENYSQKTVTRLLFETEKSGICVWKFTITSACSVLGHKRTD